MPFNKTYNVGGKPLHNAVIPSLRVILTNASCTHKLNYKQQQSDWSGIEQKLEKNRLLKSTIFC